MAGRRFQLARLVMNTGLHRPWSSFAPASLLVVNYHRLWPAAASRPSDFDDGVFGPDVQVFRRQMEWLQAATEVLDEEALLRLGEESNYTAGTVYSAVTFDDAYVDCYSIARPVLDDLAIRAIFFVPVDMISSRSLGWWDQAAYLLKRSRNSVIRVRDHVIDLQRDFPGALRCVLDMFKLESADRTDRLLDTLSSACQVALPDKERQSAELMTWEQIRSLRDSGHAIGSHTFSHRVLATLSAEQQAHEIKDSRSELASRLGSDVRSFAYPVGGPKHINETSVALSRQAGYEQAFTFNTGIATLPVTDPFRIPRESAHTFDVLRAKVLVPALMGIRQKQVV